MAARAKSSKSASSKSSGPRLQVVYPKRMRPNKTYALRVTWRDRSKSAGVDGEPLSLRLVMAGAQAVPAERKLDPSDPKAKATFYVTPITKGWLKGERLEVIQNGEKIQEISLPAKAVSNRMPWFLLLLAIIVPWWLASQVQSQSAPIGLNYFTKNVEQLENNTPLLTEDVQKWIAENGKAVGLEAFPSAYNYGREILRSDEWEIIVPVNDGAPKENGKGDGEDKGKKGGGGATAPRLGDPDEAGPVLPRTAEVTRYKLYLPFFTCVTFLVLAFLSGWVRRERQGKRVGKPLPI